MPTSIAVQEYRSKASDELMTCAKALLDFYSLIAALLSLIFILEAKLGMFEVLSVTQALLKATGADQVSDAFISILQ